MSNGIFMLAPHGAQCCLIVYPTPPEAFARLTAQDAGDHGQPIKCEICKPKEALLRRWIQRNLIFREHAIELGLHRGTMPSCRTSPPIYGISSYNAALTHVEDAIAYVRLTGWKIWYANIILPDGTRKKLESLKEPYAVL